MIKHQSTLYYRDNPIGPFSIRKSRSSAAKILDNEVNFIGKTYTTHRAHLSTDYNYCYIPEIILYFCKRKWKIDMWFLKNVECFLFWETTNTSKPLCKLSKGYIWSTIILQLKSSNSNVSLKIQLTLWTLARWSVTVLLPFSTTLVELSGRDIFPARISRACSFLSLHSSSS